MTKLELKIWYQERKLSKERKIRRESYHRCKERHDRKRNTALSETKKALWKRKQRQRKKEKEESRRKSTLDRVHKYRAKQVKQRFRNQSDTERDFKHKMEKSRSINKLRKSLPQTPKRRSTVLQAYLEYKSPTAKTVRKIMFHETPNLKPVIDDLKSAINSLKMKRSNDARAAVNVICASVNGNSVQNSKSQKKVARILGLPIRRLSGGKAIRTRVLSSAKSSWTHTDRKTRSDSLSEQDKNWPIIFGFFPTIPDQHAIREM
ncbi:hypothetical protein KUTeg_010678 [Tegillarca granosa]|uniref:Uncharacterized protein n=1 Tax=Tegillarca granosa TaxID=220873 RepID=A0ABQ9F6U3_TEGGR|nr:hypothetical protein KUTeg_010678 [Tegillarca granosa]